MSGIGLVSVVIGIVIIATRAPLIVAPRPTLALYARLLATRARVRVVGLNAALLGVAALASAWGADRMAPQFVGALGWLLAGMGAWVLLAPDRYRRFSQNLLATLRDAVDPAILRGIGLLAVSFGGFLIHLGVRVL